MVNLNLGTWAQSSMTVNDPVCIYRQTGGNAYRVTPSDNSTLIVTGFYMQNTGGTYSLPYSAYWGNTSAPGTIPMADTIPLNTTGANTVSQTCASGGISANLRIDLANSDLAAVPAGTYRTTVTLVVQGP